MLKCFRELRFMDETIYLRTCMRNIFNGMIGPTFSVHAVAAIVAGGLAMREN